MHDSHKKIIISTQPEESFPDLEKALKGSNIIFSNYPMIAVSEAAISTEQTNQLEHIKQFQWLIFTSKNGVYYFFNKYKNITKDISIPKSVKIAVIGEKTGKELLNYHINPNFVSKSNLSEIFAKELEEQIIKKDSNVLLLLGNLAGNTIETALRDHAMISRINCYETTKPQEEDLYHIKLIASGKYDLIIFTSSSGFQNFAEIIKKHNIELQKLKVASIGKSTTKTMEGFGVKPVFTAKQSNIEGIANEIKLLK